MLGHKHVQLFREVGGRKKLSHPSNEPQTTKKEKVARAQEGGAHLGLGFAELSGEGGGLGQEAE